MPSWRTFKRYLDRNGWELYSITDHYKYRKRRADGMYDYTKCSMGSGEIKRYTWQRILRNELHITQEEFNEGLK